MKHILLSLGLFLMLFLTFQILVFAQSDEEIIKKYEITFPIEELGNCQNLNQCKTFCDDIKNKDACISYATKKGFYGEPQEPSNSSPAKSDEQILNFAKAELGCSSYDQCLNFCDQKNNWKRCEEFAYKHGLGGEEMQKIREAMDQLGCTSPSSCMSVCSNPANMQRCMEVFQSVGFNTNVSTISLDECRGLNPDPNLTCQIEGNTCTCTEPPESWCPQAGSPGETCTWDGSTCNCYNPSSCEQYEGCKWTGNNCECTYVYEQDLGAGCSVQPGCSWTGTDCLCQGSSFESETPEVWCPQNPGCSWDGSQCLCSSTGGDTSYPTPTYPTPESPEISCTKYNPQCSWTGTECTCAYDNLGAPTPSDTQQVQGITTVNILQSILRSIKNLLEIF